jgi:hypothetical protein
MTQTLKSDQPTVSRSAMRRQKIAVISHTLTSAMPDCLMHHTETVVIESKIYRMKEVIEN